ncbi:GNAT family N-acetyltransferase [Lewinella sp. W8]|uniref:GNAT family N-acetyltransferase n=1 Tax=Lewinella sp. W8 TaxID=2528208 RepID=UPI0010689DCC|nr:GNAT family N-acetyltransferase [Lewinella sp. W8]MTB51676.1 GNAT family N-acetyltransferase [Lewinella sp. W8]
MHFSITPIEREEYPVVVDLWEASVRATHHFLREADIQYFRPLILEQYLDAVTLRAGRDAAGNIMGFLGVADDGLEMLFLHPDHRGKGLGGVLLTYAIREMGVRKVDVNEQNEGALGFYRHYGFRLVGRSPLDGTGKPYPILHLELSATPG